MKRCPECRRDYYDETLLYCLDDGAALLEGPARLGRDGAKYLASLGVAMVGMDTSNFEVIPFENGAGIYEVHQILLALNGIHILENMNTEEMAKDQAWEFLFTLGAARITGGVQAIVNPIAIK